VSKVIDLTGQRFGELTVIKRVENNKHKKAQFLCRCDCGRETVKLGVLLLSGRTTSCGRKNLIGLKFGRWTVLEEAEPLIGRRDKRRAYLCKCECGTKRIVSAKALTSNKSLSCGCLPREILLEKATKYANVPEHSYNRLYGIWIGIKKRCTQPYCSTYKNYGGRGIEICDDWKDNFQAFYDWAINSGYKEDTLPNGKNRLTIDRIDNEGNYCPENCRWVEIQIQSNNKRTNHYLEFNGKTQSISSWSKETGIPASAITQRINKWGWSAEKALTTPVRIMKRKANSL